MILGGEQNANLLGMGFASEVVSEAINDDEAAAMVYETQLDIVLLDLVMPQMNGIQVASKNH